MEDEKPSSTLYRPDRIVVGIYFLFEVFFTWDGIRRGAMFEFRNPTYLVTSALLVAGLIGLAFSKRWAIWLLAICNTLGVIGAIALMQRFGVFFWPIVTNTLLTLYCWARLTTIK